MLDRRMVELLSMYAAGTEKEYWGNGLSLLKTLDWWEGEWTRGQSHFHDQLCDRIQDYAWRDDKLLRVKFKGTRITPQEVV